MHRLGAPAVELLKFQSFGWISILALRLYQVSLSPRDLSPRPPCILAHLLATIAAACARPSAPPHPPSQAHKFGFDAHQSDSWGIMLTLLGLSTYLGFSG